MDATLPKVLGDKLQIQDGLILKVTSKWTECLVHRCNTAARAEGLRLIFFKYAYLLCFWCWTINVHLYFLYLNKVDPSNNPHCIALACCTALLNLNHSSRRRHSAPNQFTDFDLNFELYGKIWLIYWKPHIFWWNIIHSKMHISVVFCFFWKKKKLTWTMGNGNCAE